MWFLLFLSLTGCAFLSSEKSLVVIKTQPVANVYAVNESGTRGEDLGPTPLSINQEKLDNLFGDKEWYSFKIEYKGYVSENIAVEKGGKYVGFEIQMHPVEWWNDPENNLPSRVAQQIGLAVKNIYRNIRQGNIEEALESVEKLIQQYPTAPIFFDIQGSLFILKNQNSLAISSFEKSLKLEPVNSETIKQLEQMKKASR